MVVVAVFVLTAARAREWIWSRIALCNLMFAPVSSRPVARAAARATGTPTSAVLRACCRARAHRALRCRPGP